MRTNRKYTQEFKQEAVNLALKSASTCRIAKELGLPEATLYSWINQIKNKPEAALESIKTGGEKAADIVSLLEENRRLHKELANVREEKEILKKAAAYFAQHQK